MTQSAERLRRLTALPLLLAALGPSLYLLGEAWQAGEAGEAWLAHFLRSGLLQQFSTTLAVALEALLLALLAGALPALLLGGRQFAGRALVAPLLLLPLLFAPHITVQLWSTGFSADVFQGRHALALQQGLAATPYVFLIFRIAAARLPAAYTELAAALGLGPWQRRLQVQLPLLAVPLAASSLIVLAQVMGDYAAAARLGLPTLSVGIHTLWLGTQSSLVAALCCSLLILPTLAMVLLGAWAATRVISQNAGAEAAAAARRRPLSNSGTAALLLWVLAVSTAGFWAPLVMTLRGLQQSGGRGRWDSLPADAANALLTAGGTLLMAALLALALLALLRVGARSAWLERLPWLFLVNFFLPSLVLALAFVMMSRDGSLGAALLGEARDTRLLINAAEALRFLPLLLLPLLDALRRTPPTQIELARALGQPRWRARATAFAGQVLPALGLGLALIFIESLKSLDLSLTLQPFGYSAPALKAYAFAREQVMDRAAGWVLLGLVLMLPAWAWLCWQAHRLGGRDAAA